MRELADKIRDELLIFNSQGQPANAVQVEDAVALGQLRLGAVVQSLSPPTTQAGGRLRPAAAPSQVTRGAASAVPAATAAAANKLAQTAPEINFEAVPFADAIDFLRDVTGLNVFVNWRALEAAGVERNAPVTVKLKDVPYELALRYILRDVGGNDVRLHYAVVDGVVNVSTEEALASYVVVRVYDVSGVVDRPSPVPATSPADVEAFRQKQIERVMQILAETVEPDSWRDAGGTIGSMREINGKLVVVQTEANHAAIATLLDEISAGRAASAKD